MKRTLVEDLAALFATEAANETNEENRAHLRSCQRWWAAKAANAKGRAA